MKALQLTQYGQISDSLAFREISKPTANDNDVLIEVRAAAINPIDNAIILGHLQSVLPVSLPSTVAYDVSGVVVEAGADVRNFEVGDLVYSRVPQEQMGTLTEYVAVHCNAVAKKPGNISFVEAASIPLAGLTAMQALEHVGIEKGQKILIHAGSGGVGTLAIQYAKAKGAYVYTTTSTTNVNWVEELGADRVIDYKTEDYKAIVKDVDIVFDTLGDIYTVEAFDVLRHGGQVISVKGALDPEAAKLLGINDYKLPTELAERMNSKEASYKYILMHPNGTHLEQIKALVEEERIKPIVDTVYSFPDGIKAFTHLATGRAKGKIVIAINS